MAFIGLPARPILQRPPVEVVDGAYPVSVTQVAGSIVVASVVMLLLGSQALLDWVSALPVSPLSDFLLAFAQSWHDFMHRHGLTTFAEVLRRVAPLLR